MLKRSILKRIPRRGRYLMHYARMRRLRGVSTYPMAWAIWLLTILFVLCQFALQLSSGQIVSGVMHSFHLTTFGAGILLSAYYYIYTALQAPVGMLIDRYGPRKLLSGGAFVCGIGCVLFATAKLVMFAMLGRLLMGGGAAFAFVGCLTIITRWFPTERFGVMLGVVEATGMIGTIILGYGVAHIMERYGWQHAIVIAAILFFVLSVLLGLMVRDVPPGRKAAPMSTPPRGQIFRDLKALLVDYRVWSNALYSGLMFGVLTVFNAMWCIPFLQLSYHFSLSVATIISYASFLGVAVGSPVMGILDAKTHVRRGLLIALPLLALCMVCTVIYIPHLPIGALILCLCLLGFSVSAYALTFIVGNQLSTPYTRGTSIGFVNMWAVGTAPVFQAYIGYLLLHFAVQTASGYHYTLHSYHHALTVLPVMLLAAFVLAFFIPRKVAI